MQDYYIPSLPSNETYPFAIYIDAKEYSAATGSKLIFNMSSQRFAKSIDGDYKYLYNTLNPQVNVNNNVEKSVKLML